MKRVVNISEALGAVNLPQGPYELCASGDANLDEAAGRMEVKLEAFLRPTDLLVKERHVRADWLPASETAIESVGHEEALDAAHEIFRCWVRKVRNAAPGLHGL